MAHRTQKVSIALFLALAAMNGAPAFAQSGSANGDALQNARQNAPKFGGSMGGSMGGARIDGGVDKSNAPYGTRYIGPGHSPNDGCKTHLTHGMGPSATFSGGNLNTGERPMPQSAPKPQTGNRDGQTPPMNKTEGSKKPDQSNQNTNGAKGMGAQQPRLKLPGKKYRNARYDINTYPPRGPSEVGGLEFEDTPIEYREGSGKIYNKTKQPGIPKYGNLTMSRPKDTDKFAKEILRDARLQVELEELKAKHYPERRGKIYQRSSKKRIQ
ncbi:MAG: hypothetical protein DHS20C05_14680 [Hyphococcus sp.]|nr:MAG: hypothetical protein DHS20C05_14680 [Marinicaulis sp.]